MAARTPLESPESSSPVVTRAVAAGLSGVTGQVYQFSALQTAALRILGRLPQDAARFAITRVQGLSAVHPARLANFHIQTLIAERLDDYHGLSGPFPNITLGAALGGASAHLALSLAGPFLPQAFVVSLQGGALDGNTLTYFQRSAGLAAQIAENNPDLQVIQHYDPVHDEWLTRRINHLRFKLLDLPDAYRRFILDHLQPGGSITYLDCQAGWLRYKIGPRHIFQVGGWGDVTPLEFLQGSPRLREYARATGLKQSAWPLPGYPLEEGPESEWGVEPGLDLALEDFCRQHGFRFVRIRLPEPHDYSRLAFQAVKALLQREGRQPAGALVETFSQFDASAPFESGLLPVWLVFNTQDSRQFLSEMIPQFPESGQVFFSPLSTFTRTPDLVAWQDWNAAIGRREWINIGARATHYPADAQALLGWQRPLRAWIQRHHNPITGRLAAEDLLLLANNLQAKPA